MKPNTGYLLTWARSWGCHWGKPGCQSGRSINPGHSSSPGVPSTINILNSCPICIQSMRYQRSGMTSVKGLQCTGVCVWSCFASRLNSRVAMLVDDLYYSTAASQHFVNLSAQTSSLCISPPVASSRFPTIKVKKLTMGSSPSHPDTVARPVQYTVTLRSSLHSVPRLLPLVASHPTTVLLQ